MTGQSAIPEGKVQPIRQFTAQVRADDGETIVGTAFAVDVLNGLLVTCRHVVEDASPDPFGTGAKVKLYFPLLLDDKHKPHDARVVRCFDGYEDDVVIVQIDKPPLPSGVEIAKIGDAGQSIGYADHHRFRSFGFRRLADYQGLPSQGTIVEFTLKPERHSLHGTPVMLNSSEIDSGMSGAAVLDLQRNLVVGVIAQTWDSKKGQTDRDTNFAVDARVLSLDPLKLELHPAYSLPMTYDPPPTDIAQEQARQAAPNVAFPLPPVYHPTRPVDLPEWVGREKLLEQLDEDWRSPTLHITGLIGFGGEGKSSLAYRWLTALLANSTLPQPDALFWWNFYDNASFEAMIESAMTYLYGDVATARLTGTSARVEALGAMATKEGKRLLFVLDGFEVMQEAKADRYGVILNTDLRRLLELFAAPDHQSFCLVTSRAPLLDLLSHTAYRGREVDRLTAPEGRDLLRNVGVTGSDADLEKVVESWGGHALTLSLVGAYLKERFEGDVAHIGEIPPPTADEGRYQRVHRVLRRYDEQLTEADKAFLKLFSAFRLPVRQEAFSRVFRKATDATALNAPLTGLDDTTFFNLVARLVDRRIIRAYVESTNTPVIPMLVMGAGGQIERIGEDKLVYTTHPLVRAHYNTLLMTEHGAATTHKDIAAYYQSIALRNMPQFPTLDDLAPFIEIVHHLCCAGAYDDAFRVYRDRIDQGSRNVITSTLAAFETEYSFIRDFFTGNDTGQEPQVSDPRSRCFILNEVGLCLMNLGRISEAAPFYERAVEGYLSLEGWYEMSTSYRNLSDLYTRLGALERGVLAAREALLLVGKVADDRHKRSGERTSLTWLAWTLHLQGVGFAGVAADGDAALHTLVSDESPTLLFSRAEELERENTPQVRYLYSLDGIQHADHLRRKGEVNYARQATLANVEICQRNGWQDDLSSSHRILGDLDADAGQIVGAREHYDAALRIARGIQKRDVLIEALLARGRWQAKHMKDAEGAFGDLNEALGYATSSGYRIYEADIRVGLAWAHLRAGNADSARAEATRAKTMSAEMGYYWGQVDADEVLAAIEGGEKPSPPAPLPQGEGR